MAQNYLLNELVAQGLVQENVSGQRSKIIEIEVPRGKLLWWLTKKPLIFLPRVVEVQTHTLTSGEISAGEFDIDALTDTPCKPPSKFIPTWPDKDGYTFKVFIAHYDDTYGRGAWTRATINAVDWASKVLTIALPSSLPDYAGNSHNLVAADKIKVRISYAPSNASFEFARETPDNAVQTLAREFLNVGAVELQKRDPYGDSRLQLGTTPWAVEFCLFRIYMTCDLAFDFGQIEGPGDTDTDLSLTATQVIIPYSWMDLAEATARWMEYARSAGRRLEYSSLYSLFVAQLAGQVDEVPPLPME